MIKYPDGRIYKPNKSKEKLSKLELSISASNRGMAFEKDINFSNAYYVEHNIALITKRPTPINVVKVDYTEGPKIIEAYFDKKSTTDYNGIYKGKYLDFEAKSTLSKTSFPLSNIFSHQIDHLKSVIKFGGIAFFIINFNRLDRVFVIPAQIVINFVAKEHRKSIPLNAFEKYGSEVKRGYNPRLYYLKNVDELFFK